MTVLATAFLSGWGIGAGIFLVAAAGALTLRGLARTLGTIAGLSLAAVCGAVAIVVTVLAPPPVIQLAEPPVPGSAAELTVRGAELLAEAESLVNRGNNDGADEALNRALELFRSRNDVVGQGHVYLGLGRVAHVNGQGDTGRAHYAQALEMYRQAGSLADEARVLVSMGDLEMDTFQWDAAVTYFREGRRIWEIVPSPKSDPHVLLSLESVVLMPEGEEAAWAVLDQASLIFDNLGDIDGLGDVTMLRANLHATLDDDHAALSDYIRATFLYQTAGNREREALASVKAAEFEVLEGHNIEAAVMLERAESIFSDVSNPIGEALAEVARGDLARLLGSMAAARVRYATAAEAFRIHGHPAEVTALLKLGQVEAHAGNAEDAWLALEAAARLSAAVGALREGAIAQLALGGLATIAGDYDAAQTHGERAERLAGHAGEALFEGRALLHLAELAATAGQMDTALAGYDADDRKVLEAQVPMDAVLTALGRAGLVETGSEAQTAHAHALYREASAVYSAFTEPVAEANRYLGLPPVHRIDLVTTLGSDQDIGGDNPDPVAIDRFAAEREENLAAYPDHNLEARTFLAEVEAKISSGLSAVN